MTPSEPTTEEASATTTREMTYGEKLVGLNFNPSNDDLVGQLKAKYAEIIDILNDAKTTMPTGHSETMRYLSIAITEAQTAQMRAVKAVTAK